ncbi:hypothetical protein [Aliikangiella coralliicola]|uniref:Uncharacterized protein n=1 Tax=Aliikangiella coralliicola TaxID=2592383 RepID=A0A545U4U6_9GAMM|nr:hypothetical protein [Aliikangiella coralliicola]TQV84482.1 hypothetical protein FLL46_22985 [Aliikangiella coralliicola]
MRWYTLDNGRLCLGTDKQQYANFHIATDVVLPEKITAPLRVEHVELIGSFPEDWYSDEKINDKINNTARHFFGMKNCTYH